VSSVGIIIGENSLDLPPDKYLCSGGDVKIARWDGKEHTILTGIDHRYYLYGDPVYDGYRKLIETTHGIRRQGDFNVIKASSWAEYTYFISLLRGPCEKETPLRVTKKNEKWIKEGKLDWSKIARYAKDPLHAFLRGTALSYQFWSVHDFSRILVLLADRDSVGNPFGFPYYDEYAVRVVDALGPLPKFSSVKMLEAVREKKALPNTLWENDLESRFGIV